MGLVLEGVVMAGWLLKVAVVLAPASSTEQPIDLQWSAPSGCPTTAEVLARVEAGPEAHPVHAEGSVTENGVGWSLTLRIEGYGGADVRTLEGESCEALADAAALLIQVATGPEPEDGQELTPESSEPEPQPELAAAPEVTISARPEPADNQPASVSDPAEPAPSAAQGLPLGVHARAAGIVQLGALLPGTVAGGAAVAAGVNIPWFRAEVRGTYLAPREQREADNPSVGIRVDGWGLGGSGCGVWDGGRVFVPACLGAQLGRTRARAFGLEQPGVGRGLWAHVVADLALGVRVSPRVAITAAAEAAVSLRRPSFRVRGFPPLFKTGVAAGRVVVGVEVLLRRPPARESRG